jgi:class 3 adenylate cyclase
LASGEQGQRGLTPYLPAFLVRKLARSDGLPRIASEEPLTGATLFVDLAGFTQLTERLAGDGPDGAERLSEILDDYFGRMTAVVEAHGGDVAMYAGDAVLAVWPSTPSLSLASATILAVACAADIRARIAGRELAPSTVVRQRAVVGAGAFSFYDLGGIEGRWLWLVAGPALASTADAMHAAGEGDLLMTRSAWELVADRCHGAPLGESAFVRLGGAVQAPRELALREPAPRVADALLAAYVPEVLASRIQAGHADWIAEFRGVTAVFVGLVSLDPAPALSKMQVAMATFQDILRRYGGTAYQASMDDKGTVLIGVFGLPPYSQENCASRGVEAALALRAGLLEAGLRSSVGLATGQAFCGTYGGPTRRHYAVVGSVMNLAARLMVAAGDGVLCDTETEGRARGRIAFDDAPSVSPKGLPGPVRVFVPKQRLVTADVRQPLVGRGVEARRLEGFVERLREGRGGVVVIKGAAGIGKSSLLEATRAGVTALPGTVLRGGGEAIERFTPYFAWRGIARSLLDANDSETASSLASRLLARLTDSADENLLGWCPLLNVLLPLGLPDNEITANMSSEARAGAVQQLLVRLLEQGSAERPVALFFDDIQWMDSASAHLVKAVAERLKGILIVGAARPLDDAAAAPAAPFFDHTGAEFITLGPLSPDEARTLLCRFLAVDRVDDFALAFILGRTGGHPFFIEELARALRRSGVLRLAGGAASLAERDIRKVKLPDSIQAAIVSQADRLSPHDLLALKIASVIGPSFSYEQLHTVYPVPEDRGSIHRALENLERLEFVAHQGGDGSPSYVFRHALIQEAMYDVLPASQKRKVHASVASLHESRPDSARADVYPLLSHHWERAGNAAKAVFYLEKAADEAVKLFSSREAESFLDRASELAKSDPKLDTPIRAAVRERLRGEAAYQQAAYDRARQHFSLSLSLRDIRVPRTRAATATDLVAQILRQLAHRAVPARYVENRDGDRRETLAHAALVFNRFSSLAWFRGDQLALVHSIFKVLNLAEEAGDVGDMVHGSAAMAVLCGLVGLDHAADFYCRRAIKLADDSKNPSNAARARVNASVYAIGSALWDQAEAHVAQSLDLHLRLGDRQHWEGSCALNGYLHLARGQFAKATSRFDEVYASALAGRAQSRVWARIGHIAAQLPRGPVPLGLVDDLLRDLPNLAAELPDTAEGITAHGLIAQAHLHAGRRGAAIDAAELGLQLLLDRKPGAVYYAFWGVAALAETWLSIWQARLAAAARERAERACSLLRAFARTMPMARPRSSLCDGRLAALAGRPTTAIRKLREGLDLAMKLQMPFDQALLHSELGCRLEGDAGARSQHHATAADLLAAHGANAELERSGYAAT